MEAGQEFSLGRADFKMPIRYLWGMSSRQLNKCICIYNDAYLGCRYKLGSTNRWYLKAVGGVSVCGTMGSVASLQCQDAGSITSPA